MDGGCRLVASSECMCVCLVILCYLVLISMISFLSFLFFQQIFNPLKV